MTEAILGALIALAALFLVWSVLPRGATWTAVAWFFRDTTKTLVNPIDNSVVVPRPVTPEVIDQAREVAQDFRALEQLEARKPERNAAFAAGIKAVRANFLSEPEAAS